MGKLRSLIAFYSRTGVTRKVALAIAEALGGDTEAIEDTKDRTGLIGYLAAARDAMKNRPAEIREPKNDPAAYDVLVLGTPVWTFTMSPAMRAYIGQKESELPEVAFFCTMGSSGSKRTFAAMAGQCGKRPVAALALKERTVRQDTYRDKVAEFVENIRAHFRQKTPETAGDKEAGSA